MLTNDVVSFEQPGPGLFSMRKGVIGLIFKHTKPSNWIMKTLNNCVIVINMKQFLKKILRVNSNSLQWVLVLCGVPKNASPYISHSAMFLAHRSRGLWGSL